MSKKRALGKGLGALLDSADIEVDGSNGLSIGSRTAGSIASIPLSQIDVNPENPRRQFGEEALEELATSIGEHGIIQPLTVRKLGKDEFQLISGERRYRASQLAGLKEVPCYIRVADDQEVVEMALVENIQRVDLNAIEVAFSYQRLIDECNFTQEELANKIGKSRSNVANFLRLLKLPVPIQLGIREGLLSMGHARALLAATNEEKQLAYFKKVVAEGLSVRDTEALVSSPGVKSNRKSNSSPEMGNDFSSFQSILNEQLEGKVKIKGNASGGGKIEIAFSSEDQLERIIKNLS